jgi:hypothetical protein
LTPIDIFLFFICFLPFILTRHLEISFIISSFCILHFIVFLVWDDFININFLFWQKKLSSS